MQLKSVSVTASQASVSFEQHGTATTYQNRYLAIDGKEVFDLGFPCESCTIVFSRVDAATIPMSPPEISAALGAGVSSLDDPLLASISHLVPVGEYVVALLTISPRLVAPGEPDEYFANEYRRTTDRKADAGTAYFRGRTTELTPGAASDSSATFIELAVPLVPIGSLDPSVLSAWEVELAAGADPTVFALSDLQWVGLNHWESDFEPDPKTQVVLTHFLLDGHHKMLAAARTQSTVGLLAFVPLASGQRYAWPEQRLRSILEAAYR